LDVNVTNSLLYVEVQNIPSSQEVNGTVSVDSLPAVEITDNSGLRRLAINEDGSLNMRIIGSIDGGSF
jgi:hypothetical protein